MWEKGRGTNLLPSQAVATAAKQRTLAPMFSPTTRSLIDVCYLCFLLNVSLPFCSPHNTDNKEAAAPAVPTTSCQTCPLAVRFAAGFGAYSMAAAITRHVNGSPTYQCSTVALCLVALFDTRVAYYTVL